MKFGSKNSIIVGAICYMLWVACGIIPIANTSPSQSFKSFVFALFIFSGLINGFGASIIWVGQGNYVTDASENDSVKSRNFGAFWGIFMGSQIFGNLIAAFLIGNIGLLTFFISVSLIACVGIALLVCKSFKD